MNQEEMSIMLAKHEENIKTIFHRLDSLESLALSVNDMALSVKEMTTIQAEQTKKIDKICGDVDTLKAKPEKRWETVIGCIITAVVTALITLLLKGEL